MAHHSSVFGKAILLKVKNKTISKTICSLISLEVFICGHPDNDPIFGCVANLKRKSHINIERGKEMKRLLNAT